MKSLTRYLVGDILKGNYTYESYLSYDDAHFAYQNYVEAYTPSDSPFVAPETMATEFFYIKKVTEEVILGGLQPND
jgi:hypothetical protein